MTTILSEQQLVEIRAHAQTEVSRFVDPVIMHKCCRVLDRRGEQWAAAVLGRDISARSRGVPRRPALTDSEPYALINADYAEDGMVLDAMLGY